MQFIQEISKDEKIHQCADLIVMEHLTSSEMVAAVKEQREACGGVCQHGGQCRNGECLCREGWTGEFCDEVEEGVAAELIWFFIITLILVVAFVFYKYGKKIQASITVSMRSR